MSVNEQGLKDALLAVVTDAKSNYIMLSSVLAEVEALRETVKGLDPTFSDVMEKRREDAVVGSASIVEAVVAGYDEIIRRLNTGEVVS